MKHKACTLLLFLWFCSMPTYSWQIKPWQAYLIEQRIKADTIMPTGSFMVPKKWARELLNMPKFRFPTYYPIKQKTMFEQWDEQMEYERIRNGDYDSGDFVADMMLNVLETIFFK